MTLLWRYDVVIVLRRNCYSVVMARTSSGRFCFYLPHARLGQIRWFRLDSKFANTITTFPFLVPQIYLRGGVGVLEEGRRKRGGGGGGG